MPELSQKSIDIHKTEDFVSRPLHYQDKLTISEPLAPHRIETARVTGLSNPARAPARLDPSPNLQSPPESRSPSNASKYRQYQRHYPDDGSSPHNNYSRKRDL